MIIWEYTENKKTNQQGGKKNEQKICQHAESRGFLHTHTHTHTHTDSFVKSLKQIGTICFTISLFTIPNFTFADNIPTTNPGCTTTVLGADNVANRSASLEPDFSANTINTTWYSNGEQLTGNNIPGTCRYDAALTPPTPAARPGYTFGGWRLIVPPFNLTTLDPTIHATSVQYKAINYGTSSEYNLYSQQTSANADGLSNGEWSANFSYGTIYGRAYCSSRYGEVMDVEEEPYWPSGRSAEWAATTDQVFIGRGEHCWCNVTGFAPVNDVRRNVSSTRWIGYYKDFDGSMMCANSYYIPYGTFTEEYEECEIQACEDWCAYLCAHETISSSSYDYRNTYLPALFGITQ